MACRLEPAARNLSQRLLTLAIDLLLPSGMWLPLKTALASALDKSRVLASLRSLRSRNGGLVLAFHRVLPPESVSACYEREVAMTDSVFRDLLRLLRNEFEVVPLRDLLNRPASGKGQQRVALTFDDGWRDTWTVAFPLMAQYQIPATVFLCTELMGQSSVLPEERFIRLCRWCAEQGRISELFADLHFWNIGSSAELSPHRFSRALKRQPLDTRLRLLSSLEAHYRVPADTLRQFLTWEEARTMHAAGITFGSHTARHATLASEPDSVLMQELVTSRAVIERKLGGPCSWLAYPNGVLDHRVVNAAREAGYAFAFTIRPGLVTRHADPLTVPRICLSDSLLTKETGRLHAARTRLALQKFSGSPLDLGSGFHFLPGLEHL